MGDEFFGRGVVGDVGVFFDFFDEVFVEFDFVVIKYG